MTETTKPISAQLKDWCTETRASKTTPSFRQCTTMSDEELLSRVVKHCRSNDRRKGVLHTRWEAVMDNFTLGSTTSAALCRRFNLDPDEMVRR